MTEETKWRQEGKREMKERWEVFRESLKEAVTVSRKEYLLVTVVCVLGGVVFGLLFSPRKYVMIGSCNGSNNGDMGGENGEPS